MNKLFLRGVLLLTCGALLAVGQPAAAGPVPALTFTGFLCAGEEVTYVAARDFGYSFTPTVDIEVTALGFWVPHFPPFAIGSEHEVAIFRDLGIPPNPSTPNALARVSIGAGGANTSNPDYRYGNVDPALTLTAGTRYVIMGVPRGEEVPWPPHCTGLTINSLIAVNGPRRAEVDYGDPIAYYPTHDDEVEYPIYGTAPYAAVNFLFEEAVKIVSIDIKPGTMPNSINPFNLGSVPVAILSDATSDPPFYATTDVDFESPLTFGKVGDEASLLKCNIAGKDVNFDFVLDVVCHFKSTATGFQLGNTQGVLQGTTSDDKKFMGTDSVRIVQ